MYIVTKIGNICYIKEFIVNAEIEVKVYIVVSHHSTLDLPHPLMSPKGGSKVHLMGTRVSS